MKITFRQSGGFAGLVRGCEVDSADLGPEEEHRLRRLVDDCGFTASFERRSPGARDAAVYEIDVERDGDRVRLGFDDASLPEACVPLLEFLQQRARPLPPREG